MPAPADLDPIRSPSRTAPAWAAVEKKSLHASEQERPDVQLARRKFLQRARHRDPHRYVFVDEFGLNLAMTRTRARAPRGVRAVGHVPENYGGNVTLVVGLRLSGPLAPLMFPGAMDGTRWNTYVKQCLAPVLRRGDIVVFDGLGAHRSATAEAALRAHGAVVDRLPPYSPDLSPAEPCGSKLKQAMRAAGARTYEVLVEATGDAFARITQQDAHGWFAHSGCTVRRRRRKRKRASKVKPL
jgi:transposase